MTETLRAAGTSALQGARSLASFLPSKVRTVVYSVLATAMLLELIWDFVPASIDGNIQATLNVLGFSMAALNTGGKANVDP